MDEKKVIVIGAGPAGMACTHTLTKSGVKVQLLERDNAVGGLCRTIDFDGYLFDIGGHRFLSKSKEINNLWHSVMGDDMLRVKRLSRIFWGGHFFNYPLSFMNTFLNLGPIEAIRCVLSYFWSQLRQEGDSNTFEGWVTNNFGKRLYEIFFKTYTEKVWAIACEDISADWAAQRIKGLSLRAAIKQALFGRNKNGPKTLADEFLYPRTGPGEFYNRYREAIESLGGEVLLGRGVQQIHHNGKHVLSLTTEDQREGVLQTHDVDYVFNTMPLPLLIHSLVPKAPEEVVDAAKNLTFRSFLVVNVILDKESIFPDNWIYVQDNSVRMGRIQNYKNWSPSMTVDVHKTSLGLEYFCTEGDELWSMKDVDLINFAVGELDKIGIADRKLLINGFVVRRKNVYPVYDLGYQKNVTMIRKYLERFDNLQTLGRQGLFHYDNSDHALLTGIYAARNFLGEGPLDVWAVNTDEEYLEG